jgi:hypothetical protein
MPRMHGTPRTTKLPVEVFQKIDIAQPSAKLIPIQQQQPIAFLFLEFSIFL